MTDLSVAGRLASRVLRRRIRSELEPPPDLDLFTGEMEALLANAPAGLVRDHHWLELPAKQAPWVPAGVELAAGEEISYFVAGRVYANRPLDIYVNPAIQLWCKVGRDGEIFRGTRDSHSFAAPSSGTMMFGNYFPNDWSDRLGNRVQDDACYDEVSGELKILVVRWADSAEAGLRALAGPGEAGERFASELARMGEAGHTPPGWSYLWHLGPADIYRPDPANPHCIQCRTHADVGILQKEVDMPLDVSSAISWRWCVRQLPSSLREDSLPSHDYLSIAVEFDNGRDITYYWSGGLPVGTGYDCPLPNWKGKEYHVVVRSGPDGLGQWHNERRPLLADYRHYMGQPPRRIVKVWLIANSIFQREPGDCDYADIILHHADGDQRVL